MTPYPLCLICEAPIMPGHLFITVMRAAVEPPGGEAPYNPDEGPLRMHAGPCPALPAERIA